MAAKILLVEGTEDRDFFLVVLQHTGLKNSVQIEPKTPRQLDAKIQSDGVDNLLIALPLQLEKLKQADGPDSLGIVVDADHATQDPSCNFGFTVRRNQVADVLAAHGWQPALTSLAKGEIFHNPDGLPDVGLWVMPDHQQDGMLEDFVMPLVVGADQKHLLSHAQATVDQLPVTLFNQQLHTTKAHIATWRAWQKPPGIRLGKLMLNGSLDTTLSPASEFIRWLNTVFL